MQDRLSLFVSVRNMSGPPGIKYQGYLVKTETNL